MNVEIGRSYEANLERVEGLVKRAIGDFPNASVHLFNDGKQEVRVSLVSEQERHGGCYRCRVSTYPSDGFRVVISSEDGKKEIYFFHRVHF